MKIACVGDSLTQGYGTSDKRDYPSVLGRLTGNEVRNFGVPGARMTRGVDYSLDLADSLAWNADTVVIMLGTNDAKVDRWDRAAFESSCLDVVGRFLPKKVVLVIPPTALAANGYGVDVTIQRDGVAPALRTCAEAKGVPVLDLSRALDPYMLFDYLHTDDAGAAVIARQVADALEAPLPAPVVDAGVDAAPAPAPAPCPEAALVNIPVAATPALEAETLAPSKPQGPAGCNAAGYGPSDPLATALLLSLAWLLRRR